MLGRGGVYILAAKACTPRPRRPAHLGHDGLYTFDNDTGPDDANHAQEGLYLYSHPSLPARGRVEDATLYDVAPTVLTMLGEAVPDDMIGRSLI